jgi:hypothetical protein
MADPTTTFTDELVGVTKLSEFMQVKGFIRNKVVSPSDLF